MQPTPHIPEGVTIDGARYEPMVIQRAGLPYWSGRWARLIRPTPIALSLSLHFDRMNLGTLYVMKPSRELPKQLR